MAHSGTFRNYVLLLSSGLSLCCDPSCRVRPFLRCIETYMQRQGLGLLGPWATDLFRGYHENQSQNGVLPIHLPNASKNRRKMRDKSRYNRYQRKCRLLASSWTPNPEVAESPKKEELADPFKHHAERGPWPQLTRVAPEPRPRGRCCF